MSVILNLLWILFRWNAFFSFIRVFWCLLTFPSFLLFLQQCSHNSSALAADSMRLFCYTCGHKSIKFLQSSKFLMLFIIFPLIILFYYGSLSFSPPPAVHFLLSSSSSSYFLSAGCSIIRLAVTRFSRCSSLFLSIDIFEPCLATEDTE